MEDTESALQSRAPKINMHCLEQLSHIIIIQLSSNTDQCLIKSVNE